MAQARPLLHPTRSQRHRKSRYKKPLALSQEECTIGSPNRSLFSSKCAMLVGIVPMISTPVVGLVKTSARLLSFEKKGIQILGLYFESLKLRNGQEMLQWCLQNRDQLPVSCRRVYRVGPGWLPLDLMQAGKWPKMGRVTFDEAHMIRNLDSTFYIAARA